ncbi:MAG: cupin domain-containing protein [Bacteroidota bacterium]
MILRCLLLCLLISYTCLTAQTDPVLDLQYQTETDTLFRTVESVGYDSVTGWVYTANINGHFLARDGNGSIGRMRPDGSAADPNWVTGLDAPTGLCFHQGKLFTTDIDRLVEVDLTAGTISHTLVIPGAKALNDVTVSPEGTLYLSDTGGDQIFVVRDGTPEVYVDSIKTPNGLVFADGVLFATLWTPRELVVINKEQKLYHYATGIPESDGLAVLPNGDFLVASWGGSLYHVARPRHWNGLAARAGAVTELLNWRGTGGGLPDVCYLPGQATLLLPTFNDHRIKRYAATMTDRSTEPYLLPTAPLAGEGLRRVTNSADPERELYQRLLFRGEKIGVYVVASETKTASYPAYPIDEFIHVLGGQARLRPVGEADVFYLEGESFLVPTGYAGDWETQGTDGLYYELSAVAYGEESWPAEGPLVGTKLRMQVTTDTVVSQQLVTEREELIHVQSGSIRLRNERGREWTFRRGDFFVLPSGFRGRWQKLGPRPLHCLRVRRRG